MRQSILLLWVKPEKPVSNDERNKAPMESMTSNRMGSEPSLPLFAEMRDIIAGMIYARA
jgi:hypothetical protein